MTPVCPINVPVLRIRRPGVQLPPGALAQSRDMVVLLGSAPPRKERRTSMWKTLDAPSKCVCGSWPASVPAVVTRSSGNCGLTSAGGLSVENNLGYRSLLDIETIVNLALLSA